MRFKNAFDASPCEKASCARACAEAEKLFSLRLGSAAIFLPGLFCTKVLPYDEIRFAYLETEYIECRTSEFPAEYDLFRLCFHKDAAQCVKHSVGSRVKAERILARLGQLAPQVEIRAELEKDNRDMAAKQR